MRIRLSGATMVAVALLSSAVLAQSAQRIIGQIKSVSADQVVVTGPAGEVTVGLSPDTKVYRLTAASADDIKPGAYIGTANVNTADGGKASEVHLAPSGPSFNGAMDADAGLMMTNGHVTNVQKTSEGFAFDVDYGAGARHVTATSTTPVTRVSTADLAALKAGETVQVTAKTSADGRLVADHVTLRDTAAAP